MLDHILKIVSLIPSYIAIGQNERMRKCVVYKVVLVNSHRFMLKCWRWEWAQDDSLVRGSMIHPTYLLIRMAPLSAVSSRMLQLAVPLL